MPPVQTAQNNPGLAAIFGSNPYGVGSLVGANATHQATPSVSAINGATPYVAPPQNAGTPTSTGSTGSTTATASAWTPANEAQYKEAYNVAQSALGRIPSELQTAENNVNNSATTQQNELDAAKTAATTTYGNNVTSNQQSKLTNDNSINQSANQGYQSLLRILGGMGAGGGSEAQYLVPQAVGTQASQQLGGADATYAGNAKTLDQNYNTYLNTEGNQQKQLNDWKTQQQQDAQATSDTSKQSLLSQIAQLTGQRTASMGGNGTAAEQPFVDQINSLASSIDALKNYNPTYNGTTPTYTAPSLSSYETPTTPAAAIAANTPNSGSTTPYLDMITGNNQKKQSTTPVAA